MNKPEPVASPARPRIILIADVALFALVSLALLAWFFDPLIIRPGGLFTIRISWGFKPVLAIVITAALCAGLRSHGHPAPRPPGLMIRLSFSLVVVLALLGGLEWMLKARGVPPGEAVFMVRGKEGGPVRADGSMIGDAELLWRFKPGTQFRGIPVNQAGFLDREFIRQKSAGTVRIISMGDSCTAEGYPPYPALLEKMYRDPSGAPPIEVYNTGVHGYSVVQGLAQYQRTVRSFDPDIVTLFFGWNDHWLDKEQDRTRMARAGSPIATAIRNAIARKRISTWLRQPEPDGQSAAGRILRVPPEDYAGGLQTLITSIRADGAIPVVLTAPRAQTIHRRLVHGGSARSIEEAAALHDQYAEITRTVAREKNAMLVDLASTITDPGYFKDDGIHFTDAGRNAIARKLHEELGPVISIGGP